MKVLNLSIALSLLCSTALIASESKNSLDDYISQNKKTQFDYELQKSEVESAKIRDAWISPLSLQYSYSRSNPYEGEQISQNAAIKMDQPIFQSGGIYYGMKFAEATRIYSNYAVDVAKRKLVKDAISLLMQIKQIGCKIQKQNLQIENSEINLAQKKEQYLNGQLDSGFLDSAVIERNTIIQALYDMQTSKERLISKFNVISDMDYKNTHIPNLELIDIDKFLGNNIALSMSESEIEKNRYNNDLTRAKYLPKISVTAGYNWSKSENQQFTPTSAPFTNEKKYYDYGFKAYIPLDIKSFNDVESSQVDYLKSKLAVVDKKRELTSLFEQVMQNIENFEKKKILIEENRDIYARLLSDTEELYGAGLKTKYDVELLKNSLAIQEIDLQVFEIDRQLEILTLYEMYKNEK